MLWAVVSSARCIARRPESPVPSMSGIVDPRRFCTGYRLYAVRLERRHGSGKSQPFGHRHELVGILRVGGVATALQRGRERAHVAAGIEGRGIARVVADHANIIRDA